MIKEWFSAKELAGLPGMPGTESGVIRKAKREDWPSRRRPVRGGGREYPLSSLPEITARELKKREPSKFAWVSVRRALLQAGWRCHKKIETFLLKLEGRQ